MQADAKKILKYPKCAVEVCVESIESALAAEKGGATRVELCSALPVGGLTPSTGLIRAVLAAISIPVHVLIRVRDGDFCYDMAEVQAMVDDVEQCVKLGVQGVVMGALTADGDVNVQVMSRLLAPLHGTGISVTFHRAFDFVRSIPDALVTLNELTLVQRVLTSGCRNSAEEGWQGLYEAVECCNERKLDVIVMAGGGINANNVSTLIQRSGVTEIHGSFRSTTDSSVLHRPSNMTLTPSDPTLMYVRKVTDASIVQRVCEIVSGS